MGTLSICRDDLENETTRFVHELFVPGRICLFGEHSDWAGTYRSLNPNIVPGQALVAGTREGVFGRVRRLAHRLLRVKSRLNDGEIKTFECPLEPNHLLMVAQEGSFFSYAAGVAYEIITHHLIEGGGIEIDNYETSLPIKKGLSSSAAFCVMIARSFNQLYDLKLSIRGEMNIAYAGERQTPSKCGRLDQCCAFGSNLVSVTFDGERLNTEPIQLKEKLYMVIVDLKRSKDTPRILTDLQSAYPTPHTHIHAGVQALLGPINMKIVNAALMAINGEFTYRDACRLDKQLEEIAEQSLASHGHPHMPAPAHSAHIQEHRSPVVKSCTERKKNSDSDDDDEEDESERVSAVLGRLMVISQKFFDRFAQPACPEELTAPFLHTVLSYAGIQSLIYGCKGIGSQGDGSAQFIARDENCQNLICSILEKDFALECLKLTFG